MRRYLVETLEKRKEQMIAALWANSAFEGKEGARARRDAIEDLEEAYDDAIEKILSGEIEEDETPQEEDTFGFFAAGRRGVQKISEPRNDEGTVRDVIDYSDPEFAVDQDQE